MGHDRYRWEKYRCGSTVLPEYTTVTRGFTVGALDALTSFDWDSMTDGEPHTEKGRTAIAQLMRYCGQSVRMDYDMGISGSYLESAAIALQKNFDYNWSLQVSNSEGKTEEEWQALVYNELNEGKPFVMAGFGFDCGHAFICDGYDPSTGEFHFNWGWSGDYDGWFAMTSLRPGEDDFSAGRQGIKGLQPFSNDHYAILSTDSKTLSFYCDDKRKERAGSPYILYGDMCLPDWYKSWDVEHVIFDSSFSEARPIYTANWFSRMEQLKDITGLNYLNTSEVIDMSEMFWGCESLESIDMSHFDTPKVEKMSHMFCGCSNLRSLDLSHFDTSRVTDMASMFYNCSSLTSLDLSHFDTSRVIDMASMFYNCSSLTSLDLSHF
ncbi:MAG: C10 family peptidase, partial [Prevotella sp.]|nr:C10 family peptidase [Prevotella sp.]